MKITTRWTLVQGALLRGRAHLVSTNWGNSQVVTMCGLRGRRVGPASPDLAHCPECAA